MCNTCTVSLSVRTAVYWCCGGWRRDPPWGRPRHPQLQSSSLMSGKTATCLMLQRSCPSVLLSSHICPVFCNIHDEGMVSRNSSCVESWVTWLCLDELIANWLSLKSPGGLEISTDFVQTLCVFIIFLSWSKSGYQGDCGEWARIPEQHKSCWTHTHTCRRRHSVHTSCLLYQGPRSRMHSLSTRAVSLKATRGLEYWAAFNSGWRVTQSPCQPKQEGKKH